MISALGFDLDNTLYPQWSQVSSVYDRAAAWLEVETGIARSAIHSVLSETWWRETPACPRLFDIALERLGLESSRFIPELVRLSRTHRCQLEPFEGVCEMLKRIAARCPLFLITDGHAEAQRAKLVSLAIEEFFASTIFTGEHGPDWTKPSSKAFVASAHRLGVSPEQCLFIGDNPDADVGGAQRAGMRTALVRYGPFARMPVCNVPDLMAPATVELEPMISIMLEPPVAIQHWNGYTGCECVRKGCDGYYVLQSYTAHKHSN